MCSSHTPSVLQREEALYKYHDTPENRKRLAEGTDRCQSPGIKYDLDSIVTSGHAMDPCNSMVRLTTNALADSSVRPYIFAVNLSGRMRVGLDGDRRGDPGATKHETLWENSDVLAAGEIRFEGGIVVEINDHSGSYGTRGYLKQSESFRRAVATALTSAGVRVSDIVELQLIGGV